MEFLHCRRRFQSETYYLIKEGTGGKDRRRYQVVLTEPEKCRNSRARTSAQCHLVYLPSSDGKAIATSPHLSRIRAAFGALGKPALGHQVDDVFQLLLFLFGPTGGQNLGR